MKLIQEALSVLKPKQIGNSSIATVACALETTIGTICKGVCIDTSSSLGFCAEHTAISQMITQGEYLISKIVAVKKDEYGNTIILPPCGRCREFMKQLTPIGHSIKVVLSDQIIVTLSDLLPYSD